MTMNEGSPPSDQDHRTRALDPSRSFIVQAPAGSGKTSLLTQRLLALLATVDAPEEVVAITFTRKATAEMRTRVIDTLKAGLIPLNTTANAHDRLNHDLARRVLDRDRRFGWQLLDTPSRLSIQTIDSLSARLVRQMPVLSGLGAIPSVASDSYPLYVEAVDNTLNDIETGMDWSADIASLCAHLDNNLGRLHSLLIGMLQRRDQWLRHVADPRDIKLRRDELEATAQGVIENHLTQLRASFDSTKLNELCTLARFAATNLSPDSDDPIAACRDLDGIPETRFNDLPIWLGLINLLLKKGNDWRARLTSSIGFPTERVLPGSTDKKDRLLDLIASLKTNETLRNTLSRIRDLPAARYRDEDWAILQSLSSLLRVSCAHLEVVFREHGQIDFIAQSQYALNALGTPDTPTDLALALDHQIRHILVDEFQDTSHQQHQLLLRLTGGWTVDDGRTLFLVGDPMQSIYRFREAEVGIFIDCQRNGLGQIPLTQLTLETNFRSQEGIVDWINTQFSLLMPETEDIETGAVSFSPSSAWHPPLEGTAVEMHPFINGDREREACSIREVILETRASHPADSIAILARNRSHLTTILVSLRKAGIRYFAQEIEGLGKLPVILDLLSLTRALHHPADRIAWLSVLRAPFCGLSLSDLETLTRETGDALIPTLLDNDGRCAALSPSGQARLGRIKPLLEQCILEQGRVGLRHRIEGLWLSLGGPACVREEKELDDAEVFFTLLESCDEGGTLADPAHLERLIDKLYAQPDQLAEQNLMVMTMHKSKGLEFDTVILPGLERQTQSDGKRLLYWQETVDPGGASGLLLGPINRDTDALNPLSDWIRKQDRARSSLETTRLLYVAATRAKKRLHLYGNCIKKPDEDLQKPAASSLLATMWPVLEKPFQEAGETWVDLPLGDSEETSTSSCREILVDDWETPSSESIAEGNTVDPRIPDEALIFDWAGIRARHTGTVVHRLLQHIAQGGHLMNDPATPGLETIAERLLRELGMADPDLSEATEDAVLAIRETLSDPRGQWIMSTEHLQSRCELPLTVVRGEGLSRVVIDRTFIDADGVRWIIDYKTGRHTGGGREAFLDREQERYRSQLERYADIMYQIEAGPIYLGLYFPLLSGWRAWPYIPEKEEFHDKEC